MPKYTNSGNQNTAWLFRPNQTALIICLSGSNTRLNLVLAGMITSKKSQNIKAEFMFFYTIYINYVYQLLVKIRKSKISWDKLKRLALKKDPKVAKKEKKGENKVLVYICFEIRRLVIILIMN